MNCLKTNPQNLDCLLSLGVSCTNTLDEVRAMSYLKQWLLFNPKYKSIQFDPQVIPDNVMNELSFKVEHVK
jgi:peroxin-5